MAKDKKKDKKSQRYMIYFVSAIMLLSGFFWMTWSVKQEGKNPSLVLNESNIVRYDVLPTGNGSGIVRVGSPLSEVAAIPKRPEFVRAESILEVLNTSFDGVSKTSVELSNAYVIFKFQADNISSALANVSSELRSFVGEVNVYRAYDGLIGGGRIYLLAEEGLSSGDFVRVILLERQDNFQTIGLQQNKIAVGPVISSKVTGLGGFYFRGKTKDKLNDTVFSEEFGVVDVEYSPVGNDSLMLSFVVSRDSDVESVKSRLKDLGVSDVYVFRQGFVSLPAEIAIGDDILQPANKDSSSALLSLDVKVNDSVNVSISYEKKGGRLSSVEIMGASLS